MFRRRRTFRRLARRPFRRTFRPFFRQRWRSPDDLAEAMACFGRAIRAHRRLQKLAPHKFDAAVVNRERKRREERRAQRAARQPALEKVYGPPTPEERKRQLREEWLATQPPPLHPRTRRAVEREYAAWQFWMESGRLARARHQQRHPHAVLSLSRIGRMLQLAFDFRALAIGRDWRRPAAPAATECPPHDVEADLRRAYGNGSSNPAELAPAPPLPETTPASSNPVPPPDGPVGPLGAVPPQSSPAQPVSAEPRHRRDAWQAWARHQRRAASGAGCVGGHSVLS